MRNRFRSLSARSLLPAEFCLEIDGGFAFTDICHISSDFYTSQQQACSVRFPHTFATIKISRIKARQTPGEEYLTLIQVAEAGGRQLVPVYRRIYFVILESIAELIVEMASRSQRLDAMLDSLAGRNTFLARSMGIIKSVTEMKPVYIRDWFRSLDFKYLNQALFFALSSSVASYTITMRLAKVHYLSMRPQADTRVRIVSLIILYRDLD